MRVNTRRKVGWYIAVTCFVVSAVAFIPWPHLAHPQIGAAAIVIGVASFIIGDRGIKNKAS